MDEISLASTVVLKINYLTTCKNGRDYIKIHFHKNTISFTTFQYLTTQIFYFIFF